MAQVEFEGLDDFQVRLKRLRSIARKAAVTAVINGMDEALDAIRSGWPSEYEPGTRSFGRRIERSLSSEEIITGLYGIGVGKKRLHVSRTHTVSGGVGITAQNVHWFILGTKQRHTRKGYNRGAMPPQIPGAFVKGLPHAERRALAAMGREFKHQLEEAVDQ